jgi:hypothetical protein
MLCFDMESTLGSLHFSLHLYLLLRTRETIHGQRSAATAAAATPTAAAAAETAAAAAIDNTQTSPDQWTCKSSVSKRTRRSRRAKVCMETGVLGREDNTLCSPQQPNWAQLASGEEENCSIKTGQKQPIQLGPVLIELSQISDNVLIVQCYSGCIIIHRHCISTHHHCIIAHHCILVITAGLVVGESPVLGNQACWYRLDVG